MSHACRTDLAHRSVRRALLALALVAGSTVGRSQTGHVGVGQLSPEIAFRSVVRGDGRTRLSEYRGQPVLLALYSTVSSGIEGARSATRLLAKHGEKGLVVLLMEDVKEHDETYIEALVLKALPGTDCALLRRQFLPFLWDQNEGPPPVMALIGIDGTVLYAGSYQGLHKVEKAVESEFKRRQEGWGDEPIVREMRALAFGANALGAARLRLDAIVADLAARHESDADLGEVAAEVDGRWATWQRSIPFLLDNGRPTEALASARALVAVVEGHGSWCEQAKALLAPLETPEAESERQLEAKLVKLLRPLESKSPRPGLPERLRRFAAEVDRPGLAKRALRIAAAADFAIREF